MNTLQTPTGTKLTQKTKPYPTRITQLHALIPLVRKATCGNAFQMSIYRGNYIKIKSTKMHRNRENKGTHKIKTYEREIYVGNTFGKNPPANNQSVALCITVIHTLHTNNNGLGLRSYLQSTWLLPLWNSVLQAHSHNPHSLYSNTTITTFC